MRALKIQKSITNRDSRSLDRFLQEIGHAELLSAEEEVELAQRIKKGDKKAMDKLINANLRFVVSVAKQYQNQGIPLEDIINEGNIGLIRAAQKFDETLGFKFISYAVWWIRQSIIQAIAEQSRLVRLPQNQVSNINKIKKEISKFEVEHERVPSTEELAEKANMNEMKVAEAITISARHTSLDAPFVDGDNNNSLLDVYINNDSPMADDELIEQSLTEEVNRALETLNHREKIIIKATYGIDGVEKTYEEIAEIYGLTRERVRQIKDNAIKKLRQGASKKILKSYLGK